MKKHRQITNTDSLRTHFLITVRIIESWPIWKRKLVDEMKKSFEIRESGYSKTGKTDDDN